MRMAQIKGQTAGKSYCLAAPAAAAVDVDVFVSPPPKKKEKNNNNNFRRDP